MLLIAIVALLMAPERAEAQTIPISQLDTLGVSLGESLDAFYGYLQTLHRKACVDEAELSYVQARLAELEAREIADWKTAQQAYNARKGESAEYAKAAVKANGQANRNDQFLYMALDHSAKSLKPCMPKSERQQVYVNSVTTKLHVVFSTVPDVYCLTPEAVKAKKIIADEIKRVKDEIQYNSYTAKDAVTGRDIQYVTAGKQAYVDALKQILAHLEDNYKQLDGLPPCATGHRAVFANGLFLGIYVIKATGNTVVTERFVTTDRIANELRDSHDPVGIGVNIACAFAPWDNGFVVSPFASLDYLNNSVNHNFAGGSYLGSTANVSGTAGVKIGPSVTRDFWLYGIAGVSVLNETLNVNFLPVMSSTSKTVAGGTVGAGFAFRPGFLQNLGHPVSLFAEYQHTWWQDAQFNSPAASPLFNYNFRRSDDVIKLGFNVHFDEPPAAPPVPSSMYVKAPATR
jgi:hypothetical protein